MYLVVRNYKNVTKNRDEISKKIATDFFSQIKKISGFIDYYCLYPDATSLVSVSIFRDKKGCDDSVKLAGEWLVKNNLAQYFPEKPIISEGEVFTGGQEMRKAA